MNFVKRSLATLALGAFIGVSVTPAIPPSQALADGYASNPSASGTTPRRKAAPEAIAGTVPGPSGLGPVGELDPAVCEYAIKLLKTKPQSFYLGPIERECLKRYLEGNLEEAELIAQEQGKEESKKGQGEQQAQASAEPAGPIEAQAGNEKNRQVAKKEEESEPKGEPSEGELPSKGEFSDKSLAGQKQESQNGTLQAIRTPESQEAQGSFQEPQPKPLVVTLRPGYLSQNLARILNDLGWKTPPGWWDTPRDYLVVSEYEVKGKDIYDLFAKILKPYRLKAKFFLWDKTVRVLAVESGGN